MKKFISKRKIELSILFLALALIVWPITVFRWTGGFTEVYFSLFVLVLLLLCVIFFPGRLSSISSKGEIQFMFAGTPYYENYDNRVSAFIRAFRKLAVLWIFAAFILISHYYMSKLTWDTKCGHGSGIPGELCKFKHYNEKEYFQEKEQFLATLGLAAIASVLTAYWNLDAIYGRRWQYLCGIYKEFIIVDQDQRKKKEILRINLCIDILDHSMWNSKQFSVFLKFELEKYYWAILQSESFKKWLSERNYMESDYFTSTKLFLAEFKEQVIDRRENRLEAPIKLDFKNMRKSLSLISAYVEEPQNNVWQLDLYPGLRALSKESLKLSGTIFEITKS